MNPQIEKAFNDAPNRTLRNIIIGIVLLSLLIWSAAAIQYNGINEIGVNNVKNVLRALIHPNWDWILTFTGTSVPKLMLETIAIGWLGTILGAILAIPFAFLSSRNITGNMVSYGGSALTTMIRTFPVFVLGLMFVKTVGLGPFAGVLTIGVSSIGMITKLYVESIEDIDKGILDALDASGASTLQKIRYGIIPQLSANFISTAIYRFEINVRNATVLGLVGAGGIGFTLLQALGNNRWSDAAACLWGIIVVVLIIEYISTTLRNKISRGE
jgi:phosphonate transport system permease protein